MSEELHKQIDQKQAEIDQKAKEAPSFEDQISQYRTTFFAKVDQAQADLLAIHITSPEAKKYLEEEVPQKILLMLIKASQKGFEIQTEKGKNPQPLAEIKDELEGFLAQEEIEIPQFATIEKIDHQNKELELHLPFTEPDKLIEAKRKLIAELPENSGTHAQSYKKEVEQNIQDSITDLAKFKADQTLVKMVSVDVQAFKAQVEKYEKDPSEANSILVEQKRSSLNFKKLGDDIFNGKIDGQSTFMSSLYQKLWQEQFRSAEDLFNDINAKLEVKEKISLIKQVEKMLKDIEVNENQLLAPQWKSYEEMASLTFIEDPKQKAHFTELEEGLLKAYLILKTTTSNLELTKDKLAFETQQKFVQKNNEISDKIRQIEVNRQTRKTRESFIEMRDLSTYIDFLGTEENGKIYRFNPAYEALPSERKQDVRMAIEFMMNKNQQEVQT